MAQSKKYAKILKGEARAALASVFATMYERDGYSVMEIAEEHGVSYGYAHKLLKEANTTFRKPGAVPGGKYY